MTIDQSVIVTGAAGTLGVATTVALADRGYRVWAGARDISRCRELEAAVAGRAGVTIIELDVTRTDSIDRAIAAIAAHGDLYGLVNNAAVTLRGYFEDLDDDEIRGVFDVNLFGLMNMTRRVLPLMRQRRRGRIVNLSSIAGRIGAIGLSAYVASKFAIEGFSESLAIEMRPLGVDVVLVEPGIVNSGIWAANRRVARRAARRESIYAQWFARAEAAADELVRSSSLTPAAVGTAVAAAMAASRPRMRYVVGRRAGLAMSLRRHLPGELFERLFFSASLRRVTGNLRGGPST